MEDCRKEGERDEESMNMELDSKISSSGDGVTWAQMIDETCNIRWWKCRQNDGPWCHTDRGIEHIDQLSKE